MASKKIKIVSALALVATLACLGLLAGRIIANRHGGQGKHGMVQLWEGGPYWATTNIGAEKPEDYGLYFWWGDTIGYRRVGNAWVASKGPTRSFSFSEENTPTFGATSSDLQSEGWTTSAGVLAPEHDAAQTHWGGRWHMPTASELDALDSNCDWTWTTQNGINGYVVRGRGAFISASIFIPAAGYGYATSLEYGGSRGLYWSSVPTESGSYYSRFLGFEYDDHGMGHYDRCEGMPIRPVQEAQSLTVSLNPNGGVGGTVSVTATYGLVMPAIKVPTRKGYTFGGYWTKANGEGTLYYDATGASSWKCDLTDTTTLYAKWTANSADRPKVQLWKSGPYWATTNIGAEKPWESGLHFWWGDTIGYMHNGGAWTASDGSTRKFAFMGGDKQTCDKDNATLRSEGWITADGVLAPAHDAAHVHWGGNWRLPTEQELLNLNDKCDWAWTTMNGVNGYVIQGRGDYVSNRIFLPAAGFGNWLSLDYGGSCGLYWSSVPTERDPSHSRFLGFESGDHGTGHDYLRFYGQTVRPVQGFTE